MKASNSYKRAADVQTDPVRRANDLVKSAECLFEMGKDQEAYQVISRELRENSEPTALFNLYSALGSFYEKRDERELQALALEKALEFIPNDTAVMFNAAYAYAEAGHEGLSLFHYRGVLQFNAEEPSTLNNLGVQYERLSMPTLSVKAYKDAEAVNNTLASANLAYKYMNAGFVDEAEALLSKAKQKEEVHPNVLTAITNLTEKNERELKVRDSIMKESIPQQEFLRAYATSYFVSDTTGDFSGFWKYSNGVEINVNSTNDSIQASWDIGGKKYQLDGTVHNRAAKLEMRRMKYGFLYPEIEHGFEKESDAFAYTNDGARIEIMKLKDGKHEFESLTRSNDKMLIDDPEVLPLPSE